MLEHVLSAIPLTFAWRDSCYKDDTTHELRLNTDVNMAEYLKQEQDAALLTSSETRVIDTSASTDPTQAMSTKDKLERTLSGNDAGAVGDNSGPSFSDSLRDIQHNLDTEYIKFEQNLETSNPRETDLVAFDWHDLETQYEKEVADAALRERQIMDRFNERFKVGHSDDSFSVLTCLAIHTMDGSIKR